jgi:prolyl oligopeptidase
MGYLLAWTALAVALCGCAATTTAVNHPVEPVKVSDVATPRRDVVENVHGVEIHDPYRWLEGDDKGDMTDEVGRWTDQQNARTRTVLDNLPGRAKLEARLRQLLEIPTMTAPIARGGRYFYTRREGTQNQAVLFYRDSLSGPPKILVDPNAMDSAGLIAMPWFEPSLDGKRVAVGLYRAGDENTACKFIDVASGQWLPDELKEKVEDIQWMPGGSSTYYSRLSDAKNPYSRQICLHHLGDDPKTDPVLFEQYKEGPLATTWGPGAIIDRQCRWMALVYWTGTRSNDVWAVDLDQWRKTGKFERRDVLVGADARNSGQIIGDTFYMQTTLDAPNGRVIAVDMRNPDVAHWKEVVPERKDATLDDFAAAKGMLALHYQRNAYTQIRLVKLDGSSIGDVSLPGIGSASLTTDQDLTEAFLTFESFNSPPTIYRLDLPKSDRTIWNRVEVPVDPDSVEVKQTWYPSKDGTKISMFIVHKKGIKLDGKNPTLLTGYGGFDISQNPYFSATLFPFYEAGGIFAMPNLRGGGEYGQEWHKSGMLDKKQNVFDDFIAAGEWLIANKYTNTERLAIMGGSNGGLLVGAALTQRPDLFRAVVCHVPLLDMLRFQRFLMAKFWVPEYGSSEDAEQFKSLIKYSPYQHVEAGLKYPAVFLTAGENDSRVHPSHARKMAAELQAATASDQTTKPILLWVERDAGHGQGKPLNLRLRDYTDQYIFVMWQLGMN